jgi:Glycosyltransferase sugar-binding region containing DXD motif
MIPKVLHYIFGMASGAGGKPWSLVHYVCLRSAIERIRPTDVFFYCEDEPTGPWWELTCGLVSVERIKAPREIFGNPLLLDAHRADVVRLESLLSKGGIYLDVDVYWDEHSVRLPYELSKRFPDEITILPHTAFFWPTYTTGDLALIFDSTSPIDISRAYATHLWETPAWELYLEQLTPRRVRSVDTNFHRWARPMIAELPNDYGAPTVSARLARGVRHMKRRVRSVVRPLVTH